MRLSPLLASALLAVVSPALFAQAASPAPKPAEKASAAKPAEPPAEIKGLTIARPDGRFLGVETEGVTLKVTFYDKEKKKDRADVVRITARWSDTKPRRTVLLPTSAETLASPPVLKRPFSYIVYIALVGADEQVRETYSFRPQ